MDTSNLNAAGRVVDQDYYHINRLVPWSRHPPLKVGDEIDVGGSSNPYFRVFETAYASHPVEQSDGSVAQMPGVQYLRGVSVGEITTQMAVREFAAKAYNTASHLARRVTWLAI